MARPFAALMYAALASVASTPYMPPARGERAALPGAVGGSRRGADAEAAKPLAGGPGLVEDLLDRLLGVLAAACSSSTASLKNR